MGPFDFLHIGAAASHDEDLAILPEKYLLEMVEDIVSGRGNSEFASEMVCGYGSAASVGQ